MRHDGVTARPSVKTSAGTSHLLSCYCRFSTWLIKCPLKIHMKVLILLKFSVVLVLGSMSVSSVCVHVNHCVPAALRDQRGWGVPWNWNYHGCESPRECWEPNLGLLRASAHSHCAISPPGGGWCRRILSTRTTKATESLQAKSNPLYIWYNLCYIRKWKASSWVIQGRSWHITTLQGWALLRERASRPWRGLRYLAFRKFPGPGGSSTACDLV